MSTLHAQSDSTDSAPTRADSEASSEADRTIFPVSDEDWDEICRILDAPPRPNEALRKLMASNSEF